jgi:Chromo (CHRromatin Organisation MOdifier) domain
MSAASLKATVLATFVTRYPKESVLGESHTILCESMKALTATGEEGGVKEEEEETAGGEEEELFEMDKILKHKKMKGGRFSYYTRWAPVAGEKEGKKTWEEEESFGRAGFGLSEYWRDLVAGQNRIKKKSSAGGEGEEEEGGEEEGGEEEGGEEEVGEDGEIIIRDYQVEQIIDHIEIDGVMHFYVKWEGYAEITCEPQENFFEPSTDLILAKYWKKCYYARK